MPINFNLTFDSLYNDVSLAEIDKNFLQFLKSKDINLYEKLEHARNDGSKLPNIEESKLIIELADILEEFIAELFLIQNEVKQLKDKHLSSRNLFSVKRLFVQRKIAKQYKEDEVKNSLSFPDLHIQILNILQKDFSEESFANYLIKLLEKEDENKEIIKIFADYSATSLFTKDGKNFHKNGVLFKIPKKIDFANLIELEQKTIDDKYTIKYAKEEDLHYRDGFHLTTPSTSLNKALDQANYCIFCHEREKDSCSHGLKEKDGNFKKSEGEVLLAGCPLEEKISEMNYLKSQGNIIGSLATIIIDNPMLPATGNRICNDCMKSCIYQNQEPVNIPEIETKILDDVLSLPYGFEIYSLFTRWNPLNFKEYLPKENSNKKILVVGMGPSGFTLSHYLLNSGHIVAGIDGLKIEPLANDLKYKLIKNVEKELYEDLDDRIIAGFGGVAEYGITVRWNKNYLKLIRLILERRENFKLYGGVRFGSQINKDIAFNELGFDHISLCMGAGRPTIVDIKNNMVRGVRMASDFLMSLQLTGAFKKNSIANLQIRLPVLVIGGGLTAIDTATESIYYYIRQIEKFYDSWHELLNKNIDPTSDLDEEEKIITDEFLAHAEELKLEKELAKKEKRMPNLISLIRKWGGVKIIYRKSISESPAYRLNHEELEKAFFEGIEFIENVIPMEIITDKFNHLNKLKVCILDQNIELEAKTILIAAGTKPNIIVSKEYPSEFPLNKNYLKTLDMDGDEKQPEKMVKTINPYFINSIDDKKKAVTFLGDMHPTFAGNVVKAMASSKRAYKIINQMLK